MEDPDDNGEEEEGEMVNGALRAVGVGEGASLSEQN